MGCVLEYGEKAGVKHSWGLNQREKVFSLGLVGFFVWLVLWDLTKEVVFHYVVL